VTTKIPMVAAWLYGAVCKTKCNVYLDCCCVPAVYLCHNLTLEPK
jgi:hypothetical protein